MINHVGQQFGNYSLIRLLGQGGFAEVYLAEHLRLKTQAAIKVLYGRISNQDVQNFTKEAQTIANLRHPHIVNLFDFDVQNGLPFLVMDYAPNGSLAERHPLSILLLFPTILSYVKQIGEALQFAHSQHFIHRDMKPENILIGRHNELLLSDFGVATMVRNSTSIRTQTIVGTTPYMAPEQILGKPCEASDQYALAILVYSWLCGRLPFEGSPMEIIAQHLSAPPSSVRLYNAAASPHVEQVLFKALAKDPLQRFGSINDFVTALEQAHDDTVKQRPVQQFILPTLPVQTPASSQSTHPSPVPSGSASKTSSRERDQAYESLRQQVESRCDEWGAIVIRAEDDHIGKVVHILPEDDWISSPPKERAKHYECVRRYVKPQKVKDQTIPTAIFKDLNEGDYMVWIDIDRPVFASVNYEEAFLVDLRSNADHR